MEEDENAVSEELDELMEEIEIEDELHQEEKVRKKNAKVLLISIVGLLTIAGVYFGINYYNALKEEEQFFKQAEPPQTSQMVKEALPLQEDFKKIEKKEGALPKEEVKKKDKNKTLPQKKGIEKLEKIKEKTSKSLSLPPKDLIKSSVEKKSKPTLPSPLKTAKKLIPETSKQGKYYIQFGQFVIKKNADNLIRSLKNKGFSPSDTLVKDAVNMYRVYTGKFSELIMAKEAIVDLKNEGIDATLKSVTDNHYILQTGSFSLKRNAEKLKDKMSELGLIAKIVRVPLTMDVKRVYIGFFKTRRDAELYQQKLAVQGFSKTSILDS